MLLWHLPLPCRHPKCLMAPNVSEGCLYMGTKFPVFPQGSDLQQLGPCFLEGGSDLQVVS